MQAWQTFNQLVKPLYTLYALPWAITTASLALTQTTTPLRTYPEYALLFFWMLAAFISARSLGMLSNHLVHIQEDSENPRTRGRPLVIGEASENTIVLTMGILSLTFMTSCYFINSLCFKLAPAVLLLLIGYSYLKYKTPFYHLVIGFVQFFGPLMTWIAITGHVALTPILNGLAVCLCIGACDTIYGCLDVNFDRHYGVQSLPARFGPDRAKLFAIFFHMTALAVLLVNGVFIGLSWPYFVGMGLLGMLFLYRYLQLNLDSSQSIQTFFQNCNTETACIFMISTLLAIQWQTM